MRLEFLHQNKRSIFKYSFRLGGPVLNAVATMRDAYLAAFKLTRTPNLESKNTLPFTPY